MATTTTSDRSSEARKTFLPAINEMLPDVDFSLVLTYPSKPIDTDATGGRKSLSHSRRHVEERGMRLAEGDCYLYREDIVDL